MKIDQNTANLIAELECIIGRSCFNPNSYDGYTGIEGRSFRYPVWVPSDKWSEKHYGKISNLTPEKINSIKYKFGSNYLYIGEGLINVLNFLEKRYGIDFNELESKHGQ